jgi:hypothetical protein
VAQVDFQECQLTLKLVYYGPPLSGKTTNLQYIHSQVEEQNRGRLMTLDTRDDRTLFFDLLPIFFRMSKLSFRVKVYTVPGQPLHEATRRVVLRGADGVAFIADSARDQISANNESFDDLIRNLEAVGLSPDQLPIVVQYNKRDLPDAISDAELDAIAAANREPVFRASAITGDGVFQTLLGLLERTWEALNREVALEQGFGISRDEFVAAIHEHVGMA